MSCYVDPMICAPALRHVCVSVHKQTALLHLSASSSDQSVHSKQPIALYGENSFSAELWPLCQIRLRAAYSLLTGAACSNDP